MTTAHPSSSAEAVQAAPGTRARPFAVPNSGIPALVAPAADLATHAPGPEQNWNDSIYNAGGVRCGDHRFGILVHTLAAPNLKAALLTFSVTDETTGRYLDHSAPALDGSYHWDYNAAGLDIRLPGLTWTGDADRMHVSATTPRVSLDADLTVEGPVMKYAGTGYYPLLGEPNYEYAFPSMRTEGTLTVEGTSYKVSGDSWLDRQWGPLPSLSNERWTWMNLSMPSGDKIAVWDSVLGGKTENAWATVLHPDGSHLVTVKPLADDADQPWTSPASGNTYPTRWHLDIPALNAQLTVHVTGPVEQEAQIPTRYEATAAFAGTYEGKEVTGENYVEMVGNWVPDTDIESERPGARLGTEPIPAHAGSGPHGN